MVTNEAIYELLLAVQARLDVLEKRLLLPEDRGRSVERRLLDVEDTVDRIRKGR